jgi:hypothetical protein
MRSVFIIIIFIAAGFAAFAQEPPATPETAPAAAFTPVAPAKAKDYPAFDGGTRVEFYADQNKYRAYLTNPADFILFDETFLAGDVGGDLSFGGFSYSENKGAAKPGPTEPDKKTGLDVSYTAGLGGMALGAYRFGPWVVGGSFDFNRYAASLGYNGAGMTLEPFFTTDDGWVDVDLVAQRYGITAVAAAALEPHVAGASFTFLPERLEGEYDFEYLPPPNEEGAYRLEELWGRRELKEYRVTAGYALRPGDEYDVGGAVGLRVLRSTLDWRDESAEEAIVGVKEKGDTGDVDIEGLGVIIDGGGRYRLLDNLRVGGTVALQFIPGITLDWRGEGWDLVGPFGERTSEDYRLANADERHYKFGGGLAFYPDEKTTLAFDYGYDRLTASAEVYDDESTEVDELELAAYHTFTRLGAERWFIDNLAARIGWEQNLFSYPRNVFFGGLTYKFEDDWLINYDYRGGQLTVNNLSLFAPLEDVVKPASHRFTVTWYL